MSGFVFRAGYRQWYAVNAEGEQSPSFHNERKATLYLGASDANLGRSSSRHLWRRWYGDPLVCGGADDPQ